MAARNNKVAIPLTIFYSCLWFTFLFIVIGFFMPTPVRFYKKISRTGKARNTTKAKLKTDRGDIDEISMYDMLDD